MSAMSVSAEVTGCDALANADLYPITERHLSPVAIDAASGWITSGRDLAGLREISSLEQDLLNRILAGLDRRGYSTVLVAPPPRSLSFDSPIDGDQRAGLEKRYTELQEMLAKQHALVADIAGFGADLFDLGMPFDQTDDPSLSDDGAMAVAQAVMRSLIQAKLLDKEPEFAEFAPEPAEKPGHYAALVKTLCATPEATGQTPKIEAAVFSQNAGATSGVLLAGSDRTVGDRATTASALAAVLSAPVQSAGGKVGSVWGLHALIKGSAAPSQNILVWEVGDLFTNQPSLGGLRAVAGEVQPRCTDSVFRLKRQVLTGATEWVEGPVGLALQDRLELVTTPSAGPIEVEVTFAQGTEQHLLYPRLESNGTTKVALDLIGERGQTPLRLRLRLPLAKAAQMVTATACPSAPLFVNVQLTSQSAP